MVCYARSATGIATITLIAVLIFGRAAVHLLNVAALMVSISIVAGGTAVLAGLVFLALRSVRRRRALAGGCVACQLKCQHAMTDAASGFGAGDGVFAGRAGRLWLVSSVDRGAPAQRPAPARRGVPERGPVRGPAIPDRRPLVARQQPVVAGQMPVVVVPAPRWPDRPLHSDVPREPAPVPVPVPVPAAAR
jgi:hypothetical protein